MTDTARPERDARGRLLPGHRIPGPGRPKKLVRLVEVDLAGVGFGLRVEHGDLNGATDRELHLVRSAAAISLTGLVEAVGSVLTDLVEAELVLSRRPGKAVPGNLSSRVARLGGAVAATLNDAVETGSGHRLSFLPCPRARRAESGAAVLGWGDEPDEFELELNNAQETTDAA